MRCSFSRMSSASCSGGRCSKSSLPTRVFAVEVAVVGQQLLDRHLPGAVVLLALVPPGQAGLELLELERLGLGVVLPALGQRVLVVPDLLRRAGAVEEEEVRGDAGVWGEHAVGQPDDGVQVELLEQLSLMRAQTPSPKSVPLGTTTPARAGPTRCEARGAGGA